MPVPGSCPLASLAWCKGEKAAQMDGYFGGCSGLEAGCTAACIAGLS